VIYSSFSLSCFPPLPRDAKPNYRAVTASGIWTKAFCLVFPTFIYLFSDLSNSRAHHESRYSLAITTGLPHDIVVCRATVTFHSFRSDEQSTPEARGIRLGVCPRNLPKLGPLLTGSVCSYTLWPLWIDTHIHGMCDW
jgi:hypothetical protein